MKDNKSDKKNIAVIGGGASGMIAAITAKRLDPSINITVFEAKEENGKKINATGNGKCNLSNTDMGIEHYRGENYRFASFALNKFNVSDTVAFFESIGIKIKDRNGYLYPHSEEAAQVSMALSLTMNALNVKTIHEEVNDVRKKDGTFLIKTDFGEYKAGKVIIACGSFANMKKWNEFKGYDLVKGLGHKITKLYPSLCQIRCSDKFFKTINGVRTVAKIDVFANGQRVAGDMGELLFTDYGISGIPAFQVSSCAAKYIDRREKVTASIDLAPDIDESDLLIDLKNRKGYSGRTAEEGMFGLLNHKLNYVLLNRVGINPTGDIKKEFTDSKLLKLANEIKNFTCDIIGTNDYSFAQVISGGADTTEINGETMESLKVPGLYFAGEIIDIDGICGGYNLQWAWSSGYIAGVCAVGEK